MKKILLLLTLFSFQFLYGQQCNELNEMLVESIIAYKNYYDSSKFCQSNSRNLYLCSDGLPTQWRNREFYESIPIETLSWRHIESKFYKEMKKGFDLIEINCFISGKSLEVQILEYVITREGKHISHAYSGACNFSYYYNCETNKWERNQMYRNGI